MKKLFILIVLASLFSGCDKDDQQKNPSDCAARIKELYNEELKCTEENVMEINLYRGIYKGEAVYFSMIMCPACNTVPPAFGYTCEQKKVAFDDFREVEDIKEVYNSCSKQFME